MQWEKLERSFQALENTAAQPEGGRSVQCAGVQRRSSVDAPAPVAATPEAVEKALAFVRAEPAARRDEHAGGARCGAETDRARILYLVLLGDGGATSGIIQNGKLAEWYAEAWKQIAEKQRPRTYVFAVGDDAEHAAAEMLARNGGTLEQVRSTEPIDFKLNAFLSKIGRDPVERSAVQRDARGRDWSIRSTRPFFRVRWRRGWAPTEARAHGVQRARVS